MYSLGPYLDWDGIARFGGRLEKSVWTLNINIQ